MHNMTSESLLSDGCYAYIFLHKTIGLLNIYNKVGAFKNDSKSFFDNR